MFVLTASELQQWDEYTVQHEPVSFIDLMERAAQACVNWIINSGFYPDRRFVIFCGPGNNGGDGLAISRLLHLQGYTVLTYVLSTESAGTRGFQANLARLQSLPIDLIFLQNAEEIASFTENDVIIDALFGSGLNKELKDTALSVVKHINQYAGTILSIDLPSGLFADHTSAGSGAVKATHTLSFQVYKKALLVAENAPFTGTVHILDIGLHQEFLKRKNGHEQTIDEALLKTIFKPRNRFSHKGTHGHALIIGGSYGSIGAILLSTLACLRSGAGLVTSFVPACGYTILQSIAPEAMVITGEERFHGGSPPPLEKYNALGIGPGMGTQMATANLLKQVLSLSTQPIVLDADALNCLSLQKLERGTLPYGTIITPHPKEFERLFGHTANEFERLELARKKSVELKIVIVLKGHHTFIACPDNTGYFNTTGNAGMAKGGSGDVLTGLITGLLAQKYTPPEAAVLGVFIHGLAGDLAARELSQEAMTANDLIRYLPGAFLKIAHY